jgi:hypothetical protein
LVRAILAKHIIAAAKDGERRRSTGLGSIKYMKRTASAAVRPPQLAASSFSTLAKLRLLLRRRQQCARASRDEAPPPMHNDTNSALSADRDIVARHAEVPHSRVQAAPGQPLRPGGRRARPHQRPGAPLHQVCIGTVDREIPMGSDPLQQFEGQGREYRGQHDQGQPPRHRVTSVSLVTTFRSGTVS